VWLTPATYPYVRREAAGHPNVGSDALFTRLLEDVPVLRHSPVALLLLTSLAAGGCDIADPGDPGGSLVVEGRVTLDGAPLQGATARLAAVSHRKVYDSSIQGYHYEEVRHSLGTDRTDESGLYRVEVSRSDCGKDAGALVDVTYQSASVTLHLPSDCGEFAARDARLTEYHVAGTVRLNGAPADGVAIVWGAWRESCPSAYGSPSSLCFPDLHPLVEGTTTGDGSFSLSYVDAQCEPSREYPRSLQANVDGGRFSAGSQDCLTRRQIDLDASTVIELSGIVYMDGSPAAGWTGQIIGPASDCDLHLDQGCAEAVLAAGLTDSNGAFQIRRVARGFQCQAIYLRAIPPTDWKGEPPVPVNPPARGWERRGCGSYTSTAFHFASAG
jgi:hypothetical protein